MSLRVLRSLRKGMLGLGGRIDRPIMVGLNGIRFGICTNAQKVKRCAPVGFGSIDRGCLSRCLHTGEEEKENQKQLNKRLPPLSVAGELIWPKFINSLRNWFFTYFVIKPYFDKDFSMQEFMAGAHEAVSFVSAKLSAGEFDDLHGLVEPSLLKELRSRISQFSVSQRDLLSVTKEDIFFSFPYQIGIIIPDAHEVADDKYIEGGSSVDTQVPKTLQTRHVEITVVLHVLRGMAEIQRNSSPSFSVVDFTKNDENKYRVMVCNYRFFRDFTVGCKDPSWIINMVNHFLPAEIQR